MCGISICKEDEGLRRSVKASWHPCLGYGGHYLSDKGYPHKDASGHPASEQAPKLGESGETDRRQVQ
jgi:hypothetical protein